MPRNYTHLSLVEDKLIELYETGFTRKEIADELGLTKAQVKNWVYRYHQKQKKLESGVPLKPQGRPRKNNIISVDIKDPNNVIKNQQKHIKRLEMENELLRDFLSVSRKG